MKRLIIGIAALAIGLGVAPTASADGDCTTTVMNNGQDSYTFCRHSNPWRPATTITCLGSNHGRCTIEEGN
jgi:hypothetical protein